MGNDGAMRKLGRRAAIGATSVALLLAATGSSLAAVRATRYDGGVATPGLALGAPTATGTSRSATDLEPTADFPEPEASAAFPPVVSDPAAGATPPGPPASASPSTPSSSTAPATGATPPGQAPTPASPSRPGSGVTVSSLPPASGPTPTTSPSRPSSLGCPGDGGQGALPHPGGALQAVSFRLPWPGIGPLVLLPQVSAAGGSGPARIAESTVGGLADDGSSLTLPGPLPIDVSYSLVSGNETARGTIAFIPLGVSVNVEAMACRDRSFTLYDVKGRSLEGGPLRIVGVVAPPGTVTIDPGGGTAHFRSDTPGRHSVTLLTASDTGTAGEQVNATVTVP